MEIEHNLSEYGKSILKNIDKWVVIQDYINKYPNDKIIIYVNSRNETEQVREKRVL